MLWVHWKSLIMRPRGIINLIHSITLEKQYGFYSPYHSCYHFQRFVKTRRNKNTSYFLLKANHILQKTGSHFVLDERLGLVFKNVHLFRHIISLTVFDVNLENKFAYFLAEPFEIIEGYFWFISRNVHCSSKPNTSIYTT